MLKTYVRKVFDIFFCENLVDFNEVRFHKATFNLHTHVYIFPSCQQRQLMASSISVRLCLMLSSDFHCQKSIRPSGGKKRHTWSAGNLITVKIWFFVKKSKSSARNVLQHCCDGANCLLTTTMPHSITQATEDIPELLFGDC